MEKLIEKQAVIKFVVLFIAILCSILMAICIYRTGIVYDTWGNGKGATPFFALKGIWMIGAVSIVFGLITLSCIPYGWSR